MAVRLNDICQNQDAVEHGAWVEMAPNWRWKIRSAASQAYRDEWERVSEKHSVALSVPYDQMDPEVRELRDSLIIKVLVNVGVVDWDPIEDEDGNRIECNPENVRAIISEPRTKWLGQQMMNFALARDPFLGVKTVGKFGSGFVFTSTTDRISKSGSKQSEPVSA